MLYKTKNTLKWVKSNCQTALEVMAQSDACSYRGQRWEIYSPSLEIIIDLDRKVNDYYFVMRNIQDGPSDVPADEVRLAACKQRCGRVLAACEEGLAILDLIESGSELEKAQKVASILGYKLNITSIEVVETANKHLVTILDSEDGSIALCGGEDITDSIDWNQNMDRYYKQDVGDLKSVLWSVVPNFKDTASNWDGRDDQDGDGIRCY